MKLFVGSDYHLEFWKPDHIRLLEHVIPSDLDVLVVPGDLAALSSFQEHERSKIFACLRGKARHVLFVPGNHEFYGGSVKLSEYVRDELGKVITVLDAEADRITEIEGRRFLGCTGWFPHDLKNQVVERYMNDFRQIRGFIPWVYNEHTKARDFLEKNVKRGDIVITHHLPTKASIAKQYRGSELNCFFVSGFDDVLTNCEPALWIHGHTHVSSDRMEGRTRVLCNPFAYPGEASTYDKNRIIEI